jgi:starch phosphorylase
MAQASATIEKPRRQATDEAAVLERYGCGALQFAGDPDALYERRLKFDDVVAPELADARERYEAAARAVRDILTDRRLTTDATYRRENPKRVYYVSIEFLIGRSLANNVMNLMLDPVVSKTFDEHGRVWMELLDQEPDAGLGNGGLGRLAACFLDSMATMALPDAVPGGVGPSGVRLYSGKASRCDLLRCVACASMMLSNAISASLAYRTRMHSPLRRGFTSVSNHSSST